METYQPSPKKLMKIMQIMMSSRDTLPLTLTEQQRKQTILLEVRNVLKKKSPPLYRCKKHKTMWMEVDGKPYDLFQELTEEMIASKEFVDNVGAMIRSHTSNLRVAKFRRATKVILHK